MNRGWLLPEGLTLLHFSCVPFTPSRVLSPPLPPLLLPLLLQVVGVSFHVGSAAKNLSTYSGAIASARHIFDLAELMGFHMELLDIGGA